LPVKTDITTAPPDRPNAGGMASGSSSVILPAGRPVAASNAWSSGDLPETITADSINSGPLVGRNSTAGCQSSSPLLRR